MLAAVGLLCAALLEWVHLRAYQAPGAASFCSLGPKLDCGLVALSPHSVLWGVPLPVLGMAGFVALGVAAAQRSRALLWLAALAAVASVALLGVELFALRSVCLLCEGVHVASLLLLALAWRWRHQLTPPTRAQFVEALGPAVVLVLTALAVMPRYWKLYSWRTGVTLPNGVDPEGRRWIGATSPLVTVDEYVDYSCPHCALAASRMRRRVSEDPGRLRVVRHHVPRMRCPRFAAGANLACQPARIAHCAGVQGKFWEADSWLFEHAPGHAEVKLEAAARDLGLDLEVLQRCVDDERTFAAIDAESLRAIRKHILYTPVYVVGAQRVDARGVDGAIDAALAAAVHGLEHDR